MDAETCTILQNAMRAESKSFLQYVSDAFPWTTPDELAALAKLQSLIAEEKEGAGAIAEFLTQNKQPLPYLGSYRMSFTTMNFVSLEHLLRALRGQVTRSEARTARRDDEPCEVVTHRRECGGDGVGAVGHHPTIIHEIARVGEQRLERIA